MSEFTVGQKVTIERQGVIEGITTVAKIGSLKMTLANGDHWKANGRCRWGQSYQSRWHSSSVRPYRDGDEDRMRQQQNRSLVANFQDWSRLTDDQTTVVAGIIRDSRKKEQA